MQEKEWFKAMEMLTTFNHRKNYRDKFLGVFEHAVFQEFAHFWHDEVPNAEEIKALELQAERQQQDLMYDYHQSAPALPGKADALASNLALVAGYNRLQGDGWQASISELTRLLSP